MRPLSDPATTPAVTVRPATRVDRPALIGLIRGYLDFYHAPQPDDARLVAFLDRLDADPSRGVQLVAEQGGRLVGFASLFASFDTLVAAEILVMNDLFVDRASRRRGIGHALFESCRQYARDHGYVRLDWVTAQDNKVARRFYDQHGGVAGPWIAYSIDPTTR
jgi:GNAT superfamily N-acetyltransferase